MKSGNFEFSRRTLMKAAGSTLLVPTFLKQAFAQTATPLPPLVLMMQNNGTHQSSFWPAAGAFTSPILAQLLADPVVGPKTTLLQGIYLNKIGNPGGNGHDWGWHGLYSGYDNISGSSGGQAGGGPSLDQVLVSKIGSTFTTPFKNIHCGVNAENYSLINPGRASFSCQIAGSQYPVNADIYGLYTQVFGSVVATPATTTPQTTAATQAATQAATLRLTQRKSVLDTVAADLQALEGRLGTAERAKVDVHLQAVRDFETRLTAMATATSGGGATGPRPASCATQKASPTGLVNAQGSEANAPALFTLFMQFIAAAVGCNMVQVLTFQAGRGGGHFHYAWLNLPGMAADFHNDIAHKDTTNDATSGTPGGVMVGVAQYYAGLVQSLGNQLAMFPAANGKTALDNSLVVYGNELATGPHGIGTASTPNVGYPIVLIGGAAGRLTKTGYVAGTGNQPHQRLGCSLMNIMGVPSTGFGAVANCGVFQGLMTA